VVKTGESEYGYQLPCNFLSGKASNLADDRDGTKANWLTVEDFISFKNTNNSRDQNQDQGIYTQRLVWIIIIILQLCQCILKINPSSNESTQLQRKMSILLVDMLHIGPSLAYC